MRQLMNAIASAFAQLSAAMAPSTRRAGSVRPPIIRKRSPIPPRAASSKLQASAAKGIAKVANRPIRKNSAPNARVAIQQNEAMRRELELGGAGAGALRVTA